MPTSYTRTGDDGTTGRFGGQRTSKNSALIEVIGALDEAGATLGLAHTLWESDSNSRLNEIGQRIQNIQNALFRVSADLSTPLDHPSPLASRITPEDTIALEKKIDALDAQLPELRQFILPGGTRAAASLHLARAIIRRAERAFVRAIEQDKPLNPALKPYLNRLSSYLFALARWVNHVNGHNEEHPRYTSEESA